MSTVFFAASPAELRVVASAAVQADTSAVLAGLDTVQAGDLDPAQLIDLDLLVTGNDPAEVREAVLTPAHEGPDDSGGPVLLPMRRALGSRLAHLSDHDIDTLAERWAVADGGWDAYRCGQLIRSLSLLALLAGADQRELFVHFDS